MKCRLDTLDRKLQLHVSRFPRRPEVKPSRAPASSRHGVASAQRQALAVGDAQERALAVEGESRSVDGPRQQTVVVTKAS